MAGTRITDRPFLRAFQRFLMWKPVSTVLAIVLRPVDVFLLRLSGGRWDITRISGLPVIEVTARGAKSGLPRTIPLAGLPDGDKYILIASNFGRECNPAWYYNLKANPECVVKKKGCSCTYLARETDGDERAHYWDLAVSYYVGYEAYRQRAAHRKIPVMVLEPNHGHPPSTD